MSALDSRIMVQRSPEERDPHGEYYRLYPEGVFRDYDGFTKTTAPACAQLASSMQFVAHSFCLGDCWQKRFLSLCAQPPWCRRL